ALHTQRVHWRSRVPQHEDEGAEEEPRSLPPDLECTASTTSFRLCPGFAAALFFLALGLTFEDSCRAAPDHLERLPGDHLRCQSALSPFEIVCSRRKTFQ